MHFYVADERQSLHNEICKVEHISKDSGDQIKLKDEAGKLCKEENLNFDGIKVKITFHYDLPFINVI